MSFVSFSDLQTLLTDLGNKLRKKPTAVRLTQAEYDALTSEEKHDTTKTYYVTDMNPSGGNIIDDATTSLNKVWSSKKVSDELENVSGLEVVELTQSEYDALSDDEKNDPTKEYFIKETVRAFVDKVWYGLPDYSPISSQMIWTDGTNIYYSTYMSSTVAYNYKLNGDTWEEITWNGLASYSGFSGRNIWTDGTNIYFSYSSSQYKLNGDTWEEMTWGGLTSFSGYNIWKNGTTIYYSNNSGQQYRLNGITWESVTWNNTPTKLRGEYIWTDGTNIYFSYADNLSNSSSQYKLNGDTWEEMTWTGFTHIGGQNIWTDGTDIYYSYYPSDQYKLNGTTWEKIVWRGYSYFNRIEIWTDGVNIYAGKKYQLKDDILIGDKVYYKNIEYAPQVDDTVISTDKAWSGSKIDKYFVLSRNRIYVKVSLGNDTSSSNPRIKLNSGESTYAECTVVNDFQIRALKHGIIEGGYGWSSSSEKPEVLVSVIEYDSNSHKIKCCVHNFSTSTYYGIELVFCIEYFYYQT